MLKNSQISAMVRREGPLGGLEDGWREGKVPTVYLLYVEYVRPIYMSAFSGEEEVQPLI